MELNQAQTISMPEVSQPVQDVAPQSDNDVHTFTGQLVEFRPASLGNANPDAIPFENAMLPEVSSQGSVANQSNSFRC